MERITFNHRELAVLIDTFTTIRHLDDKTKKQFGISDKKLDVMLFKLWRAFEASYDKGKS